MNRIKVTEDLLQYEFLENEENPREVVNITVLINDARAFIIDTAYSIHAKQVRQELEKDGIAVDTVVLSHFHSAHICGCKELSADNIVGSKIISTTLTRVKDGIRNRNL